MWTREDLLNRLKALGLLRSPGLERAYRVTRQEDFLPEALLSLAYADMPLPVRASPMAPTMPSARCLASALDLLEPAPDLRILLAGARGGFAAALLATVADPKRIVILEPDAGLRRVTSDRLEASGLEGVRVLESQPDETFDRALLLDTRGPPARSFLPLLADMGFLIARGRGVHELAFVKILKSGRETLQMTFNEAPSSRLSGTVDAGGPAPVDFSRLFAVEDLLVHAWEGRVTGHYDQHFRDVVVETFAGGPLDPSGPQAASDPAKEGARRAFQAAYILQSAGELERAADAYDRSLRLAPSSEAHTFLGWTLSFMGRYDAAIDECRRAIEVDPDFGNPYNDIGAYLIESGRLDDAIPWLEKAIVARRYCCYFYAHTNLARIYYVKGMREKARKCLLSALRANPEYPPARELLRRLDGSTAYFG
jgi:tetratricopeptide (TPR) repeat protein